MIEAAITAPAVEVEEGEYWRLLGYPADHDPGDRARELAAAARSWYAAHGRPWLYLREVAVVLDERSLSLDGVEFRSPQLRRLLREAEAARAVVAVVGAGPEVEAHAHQLWNEGKPDEYFFTEVFGSAVVEHLVAGLNGRICGLAENEGLMAISHYSPGYAGWDIRQQGALFDLITSHGRQALPGPLEVLESGMPRPKKSLLAVVGLTRRDEARLNAPRLTPCVSCPLSGCRFRRAPYRFARGG